VKNPNELSQILISQRRGARQERRGRLKGCCSKYIFNFQIFDIVHRIIDKKVKYRTRILLSFSASSASQRLYYLRLREINFNHF